MATNNSANIVTAAAGKVLQGAGVGVTPTFSTPTYPSASGTARKILVSDGTDNVYSTETWAVPGTSGDLLQSDGTNWTSATPLIYRDTQTLTNAQIKALRATPVELIAAPGAGKGIVLLGASYKLVYGGTNVFTAAAGQAIGLYYNNNTTIAIQGAAFISNAVLVSSASKFGNAVAIGIGNSAAGLLDNVNIAAYNISATEITGNAANNNTINITITYMIVTF